MGLIDAILEAVEILVNGIFGVLNAFFAALGIETDIPPIDI